MEDYFPLLKYKILSEEDLTIYQTVEEGIDQVLKKQILNSNSYEELIQNIKSKRYTYNKISRMLLHILCNFTKEKAKDMQEVEYIRILGMNQKGRNYLNTVKKKLEIPLISKITRNKPEMLEFEIKTTNIYDIPYQDCQKMEEARIIIKGEEND